MSRPASVPLYPDLVIMSSHPREIEGSSAASRVASLYELMHPIIKSVQDDELDGTETLVLLSTLSRFVGGIALDVLWEHLGDLTRLFSILPQVEARQLEYGQPQDDPARARFIESIMPTVSRSMLMTPTRTYITDARRS